MAKNNFIPLVGGGTQMPASAEAVAADILRLDGAVSDLAEDVGTIENWDAGDIPYDSSENYNDGTVGDSLNDLKSAMNNSITPYVTDTMTAPAALSVGDYVMANNTLYRVISPIANGATLTPNTNVVATTEADELKRKANTDGNYPNMTVGNAEQFVATVGVEDKVPYNFRTSGGSADIGDREVDELVGGTVAWNQKLSNGNFADKSVWIESNSTYTVANNVATITASASGGGLSRNTYGYVSGHKYLTMVTVMVDSGAVRLLGFSFSASQKNSSKVNEWETVAVIFECNSSSSPNTFPRLVDYRATRTPFQAKNFMTFDLTKMFGSAIADYIYSLEIATPGAGVAWFRKLFPKDYYAYDAGTLMSVKTSAHKMVGFNAYDNSTGKAKVVGGQVYQITGTYTAVSLDGTAVAPDASGYFTPSESGEITVTGGDSTTCIHLKWDGSRDGEYEPYEAHTYALDSDLELRGIPKLDADNKLYYDGDTYVSDGTVTRKYGIVDLGTLTWAVENASIGQFSFNNGNMQITPNMKFHGNLVCVKYLNNPNGSYNNLSSGQISATNSQATIILRVVDSAYINATADAFKTAMNGVYLVYELAAPTTESADPYQNPQIVNDFGTEEYVDSRDVPIPVGHDTMYQANLRAKLEMAPNSPDGDGDYIVRQSSGQNTYVPLVLPLDELPAAPDTDGTYVLKATVSSGTATFSWVSE